MPSRLDRAFWAPRVRRPVGHGSPGGRFRLPLHRRPLSFPLPRRHIRWPTIPCYSDPASPSTTRRQCRHRCRTRAPLRPGPPATTITACHALAHKTTGTDVLSATSYRQSGCATGTTTRQTRRGARRPPRSRRAPPRDFHKKAVSAIVERETFSTPSLRLGAWPDSVPEARVPVGGFSLGLCRSERGLL
jgi:hypothetical protein